MSPSQAVKTCYRKYFNFSGRATRSEYWWFYGFFIFFAVALFLVPFAVFADNEAMLGAAMIPAIVFVVASVIPQLSATVRRLHDAGFSGWFYLISFIPYIGGVVLLVLTVLPTKKEANKWGDPDGFDAEVFA